MAKADISIEQIHGFDKKLDNPVIQAAINATTNNGLFSIAQTNLAGRQIPKEFEIEVETGSVTDQKRSGRCWLFATLNDLRHEASKKLKLDDFEFSQNYCAFWDRFEKINAHLENVIRFADRSLTDRLAQAMTIWDQPEDGGWVSYADYVINKYGLVPKDIMPETVNSNNTNGLNAILKRLMAKYAAELRPLAQRDAEQARRRKIEMMAEVYRLLAQAFGRPPMKFSWSYKDKKKNYHEINDITPLEFKKKLVRPVNYVTIMNNPLLEYGKLYKYPRDLATNMVGRNPVWLNLPFTKINPLIIQQLKDKKTVPFACLISNVDTRNDDGFLICDGYDFKDLVGVDLSLSRADDIQYTYEGADHEMLLTGVTTSNDKPAWWKVENSWGSKNDFNKGYYTMSNEWWERYGYSISMPKRDLPDDIKAMFKQKPITRKLWEVL